MTNLMTHWRMCWYSLKRKQLQYFKWEVLILLPCITVAYDAAGPLLRIFAADIEKLTLELHVDSSYVNEC